MSRGPQGLRRRFRPLLILALLAWLVPACAEPPPPVLAGAAAPGFLNAMRVAVTDGAKMEPPREIDTIFVAEASNRSAPALAVARELVQAPGLVAVVGHTTSVASLATSRIYNSARVVQIAPSSSAPLYSEAGRFSFRMVPPDHAQGAFLARTVADSLPAGTRLALLFVNDDYGRGLRAAVFTQLDRDRNPVVLELPHVAGEVRPDRVEHVLSALEDSGADALLWLGRVPLLDAILPGLRERVGGIPVLGGDAVSRAELLTTLHPAWQGVYFVDFVDPEGTPEVMEFRRRFRERFGTNATGPEILSHDAAALVLAAVASGARTGEEVRAWLMSLGRTRPPHPGLSGPISFDGSGDMDRGYVLRRIPGMEVAP